ncbi:calpain-1 catalytic subunit-like isoform X2 [Littorina saxatilis]|uniref:calpain-1 catalytic subunit-like isoform X2 n=1 Tax=Littorina saxatilis TaxID=31220 RepID=UPI0038B66484
MGCGNSSTAAPPPTRQDRTDGGNDVVREDTTDRGTTGGFAQTSTGLMSQFHDFRVSSDDEAGERRPSVSSGELYTDPEFGLHDAITDASTTQNLAWKRPIEISSNPKLFSDGTTRYDIGQGGAGTCWFLSTVANISEHKALLNQVIPEDAYMVETEAYDGVFHARFWRFGKWEDVYIDDFLPIIHDTKPWGARSATDDNEFWVCLLEKAFARYHGSYNAVYGGQPGDAYLALTGGVAERIDFEDSDDKPRKIFSRIRNAVNSGAHVTCVVPDEFNKVYGLVGGHAYSLTGAAQTKGVSLLRIRNPWGNTEWTGDWSDGSSQWDGVSNDEVPRAVIDDGEFWICLDDFMTYFSQTTICALTPDFDMDGSSDSLNYVTNMYGEWQGETAAGYKNRLLNPRYLFTVPDTETEAAVVVQLIQRRENRQVDNFQVRCDLYKVLADSGESAVLEMMGDHTNSYCPEAQCSFRHKVTPGTYAIVPSTVDAGQEKPFLIRVFSSCSVSTVRELPRSHKVMACEQETSFTHDGENYPLSYCQSVHGQWKAGVNSGGQISHRDSHASNPQIVISVTQQTPIVLHVVQEQCEPRMPIGLRLYPTGNAPLDIDEIYDLYDDAIKDTDGAQSKFVQSWDVDARYMLQPGEYNLTLHMDAPDAEKTFALIVKSSAPVDVRGYQTGL